jgi:hypothetical protein
VKATAVGASAEIPLCIRWRFAKSEWRTTKLAGERFKAKYLCFQQLFKAVHAATTAKGPVRKIMTHQTELAATMMASFHDSLLSRTALSL